MQPLTLDLELLASIVFNNNRSIIKASVALLTRGAWAATGYSSRLVCLFVTGESTHLDATALRLQHG